MDSILKIRVYDKGDLSDDKLGECDVNSVEKDTMKIGVEKREREREREREYVLQCRQLSAVCMNVNLHQCRRWHAFSSKRRV
jgi:hypothetical protein